MKVKCSCLCEERNIKDLETMPNASTRKEFMATQRRKKPAQRIMMTNKGLESLKLMFKHMVAHARQLK